MGKLKRAIKAVKIKRMLNAKKLKEKIETPQLENEDPDFEEFFQINHQLAPPYNIIIDTNFINFAIKKKMDLERELMKCLCSGVKIYVTDCVIGELEKLGKVFQVALRIAKNEKINRLICDHKGIYADDCIVERVKAHRCYIVATCDTELKQRIRKIPGVPIIYVKGYKFEVEKLPRAVLKSF